MATPLQSGGYQINTDVVPTLVDFLIERKVGGLFVGGSTGEGLLFNQDARKKLFDATVAANNGRVVMMLHVGANTTRAAVELAKYAADNGSEANVAIPPTFFGMPDDALFGYFSEVAAAAPDLPFLAYDIPHMAINGVTPGLMKRMMAEIPNFMGVKCSRPDAAVVRQLIDTGGDEAIVLAGSEAIMLGSIALGAHGTISGLSTAWPEPFVAMLDAFAAGNMDEARNWQQLINRVLAIMPKGKRLGGIKTVLRDRGIAVGSPVPPRPDADAGVWQTILDEVAKG